MNELREMSQGTVSAASWAPLALPVRRVELRPCAIPARESRGPRRTPGRPGLELVPVWSDPLRPVRLTRRGRLVVVLTLAGLLFAGFALGRSSTSATPASAVSRAQATHQVVVRPGETLWSIARRVAPGADPRVMVDRIEALNGLASPDVVPGQPLRVPAR